MTFQPLTVEDGVVGAEENTPAEDEEQAKRSATATDEQKRYALEAYRYAEDAIERALGTAPPLEEAFNVNQPRFPKGHPKAGQWRPKLSTGAGRLAPGHLDRDLFALQERVRAIGNLYTAGPPSSVLADMGQDIEKVALRYSARKHYEKRLADLRAERTAIQDKMWDAWEKASPAMTPEEWKNADPMDFITPAEREQMGNLSAEEIRLFRDRDHADQDAMLGVLRELRPMGGTLNQPATASYAVDQASGIEREYPTNTPRKLMKSDLDKTLKQVLKVIPTAWLDDTNAKGTTSWLFSTERAYASTSLTEQKRPDDSFRRMEEGVDRALKGKLLPSQANEVASDLQREAEEFPKNVGIDSPEANAWRARRDEITKQLTEQKYTWLGRARTNNYPDNGLWAVVRGNDDKREYYVDWGGGLHLMEKAATQSGVRDVIQGPRDDRRLSKGVLPLSSKQQTELERAIGQGASYEGMYDNRYPVVRRVGTEEGGVGPYAAIYDWIDDKGRVANLREPAVAPPDGFHESLWDRNAPRPPVLESSHDTIIRVDPREKATVLHELSHRLEVVYGTENRAGYPPLSMATHNFLHTRTAGEEPQKLADLYPGYAYEDNEMTRPDKFVDGYIGKLYSSQATEVLTMGMEMLFFPRYGERDINKDPEMRRLILGMLSTL